MPTEPAGGARFAIGCAALVATAIGVLLIWGPWVVPLSPYLGLDGTPIPLAINDPSAPARVRRYQVFLTGLAVVALALRLLPRRLGAGMSGPRPGAARAAEGAAAVLLLVAIAAVVWTWVRPSMPPTTLLVFFAGFYGTLIQPSLLFHAVAAAAGTVALPLLARVVARLPRQWSWLLLGATSAAVVLPGLFQPVVLAHMSPAIVRTIEWHYDAVLGGALTLLAGDRERHLGYGYLMSVAKALLDRQVGPLSFAGDIRLVQTLNVAYALAAVAACWAWDRTRPALAALTLALVLPWIHNNHQNVFFPNQSGMRFIFVPLALILLRCSHGLAPRHAGPAAGALAALALLWNLETGMAVTAAVAVHLGARAGRSWSAWGSSGLGFGAGLAAAGVATTLLSGVGLGVWPLQFGIPRKLIERTTGGLGYGYPLHVDLLAILVFGCAVWAVLDLAIAARAGVVDPRTIDAAALGVLVLVWAPYYVLQPHPWNLWSYLLPGGLLLGERLFPPGPRPPWLRIPVVLAATIAVPAVAVGAWQTWQSLERGRALPSVAALDAEKVGLRVSGVMLTAPDARAIEARAEYLQTAPGGTVVLTGNTYLLPGLTGRVELFPYRDLAYAGTVRRQVDELVTSLRTRAPALVLVDDPATLAPDDLHRRYLGQLEAAIADRYRREGLASGWVVWKKTAAGP